jgi:uncharacterized protein
VKPYLLDTNVLIALAWPNHIHHRETLDWFQAKAASAFRTCPITQTAFVRISSNPAFTPNPPSPTEALALLHRIMDLPGHGFWPDDLPLGKTLMVTHRQVTDAYLLALAAGHEGILATLDRGIRTLARRTPNYLELILSDTAIA